ncbi:MAG: CHAT domain-containing tetratricopeptide repeat protein [Gemmatimonadaceae bacterium]
MTPRQWDKVDQLRADAERRSDAGDLDGARTLAEQAAHLALKVGGQTDPKVAECIFELAQIQVAAGDLTGAEPSYNAACSILNPTEGDATLLKADVLLGYGSLYVRMRLGWRAILLLDHAKSRYVELLGPDHESVGRCQSMLAVSYESAGEEEAALGAYEDAHRILSAVRGESHPTVTYVAWCRADLAFWRAMKAGDAPGVAQALTDFRVALRLSEQAEGHDVPNVAQRRAMLGTYLVVNQQFDEGAKLLAEAIPQLEAAGEKTASYCRQLAKARVQLGDPAGALTLLRRSIAQDPIGHWVAHGSERERMDSLRLVYWNLSQYLDLLLAAGSPDLALTREACDLIVSRKALGAELLATQRRAVSRGDDPELTSLLTRLAAARGQVAELQLTGQDATGEAMGEIERLEWELASRVPEMDLDPALQKATTAAVAANLTKDSALIEFVRFTRRETMTIDPEAIEDGSRDWYVAFVIAPGEHGAITLVDLGPAPAMDQLIRQYRGSVAHSGEGAPSTEGRRDLGRDEEEPSVVDDGAALRARLIDPLLPAIGNCTRLFLAPDGDLTRVPFGALPDGPDRCLIDRFDVCYVSAGRDLLRLSTPPTTRRGVPLVLADPDYDAPPAGPPPQASAATVDSPPVVLGDRDELRRHLTRAGVTFSRLPGTRKEGSTVAQLLGVQPYLGDAAREELVKAAQSPMVLHIATHGFFLPEPTAAADASPTAATSEARLTAAAQHPLVRSGLALSGANAWLRGDSPSKHVDDGILNGEDIVSMDLTATELVVLSACESGLGDVVTGEGVMGLRRAFAVAGARTLVVTLWKVPDEQTQSLMAAFYNGLTSGKGRAESLREAQRQLRAEYPAPYYWAAFICQGDPSPIPKLAAGG